MGYKIRINLSKEKYFSFTQKKQKLKIFFGKHSITKTVCYFYQGKEIAYHLFGGSREPKQVNGYTNQSEVEQNNIFEQWKIVRLMYAKYFYIKLKSRFLSILFLISCLYKKVTKHKK